MSGMRAEFADTVKFTIMLADRTVAESAIGPQHVERRGRGFGGEQGDAFAPASTDAHAPWATTLTSTLPRVAWL